jgi:hypothetical protein
MNATANSDNIPRCGGLGGVIDDRHLDPWGADRRHGIEATLE